MSDAADGPPDPTGAGADDPCAPGAAAPGAAGCGEALHELYAFLDGELTITRRAAIEAHLHGCHDCIEAYGFEAELKVVIAERCRDQVPADLRARIAAALADLDPPA